MKCSTGDIIIDETSDYKELRSSDNVQTSADSIFDTAIQGCLSTSTIYTILLSIIKALHLFYCY